MFGEGLSLGVAAARPSPLFTPDPRAEKGGSVGAELARGQIKITPAFTSALSTLSSQHPACPSQEHLKSCPVYQRNQRGVSSALRVPSRHNIVTRAATERGARALMVKCRRLVPPTPNKTSATTISARHRAAGIAIWVGVGAGAGAGAATGLRGARGTKMKTRQREGVAVRVATFFLEQKRSVMPNSTKEWEF